MRWASNRIWQPLLLTAAVASVASAGRSLRHVGKSDDPLNSFYERSSLYDDILYGETEDPVEKRAPVAQFLNSNTSSAFPPPLLFLRFILYSQ